VDGRGRNYEKYKSISAKGISYFTTGFTVKFGSKNVWLYKKVIERTPKSFKVSHEVDLNKNN